MQEVWSDDKNHSEDMFEVLHYSVCCSVKGFRGFCKKSWIVVIWNVLLDYLMHSDSVADARSFCECVSLQ